MEYELYIYLFSFLGFQEVAGDACSVERRTMIKVFKKKNLICFSGKAITECGMDCNSEATTVDREMVIFIKISEFREILRNF